MNSKKSRLMLRESVGPVGGVGGRGGEKNLNGVS